MLRQDITPPERVRADPKCDREVTVYGYARGCNLRPGARLHLAGVGDFSARAPGRRACRAPTAFLHAGHHAAERLCVLSYACARPACRPRCSRAPLPAFIGSHSMRALRGLLSMEQKELLL